MPFLIVENHEDCSGSGTRLCSRRGLNFYFRDDDDSEDERLVRIFRDHERKYKALDFKKKNLTLLGAKRRKLDEVSDDSTQVAAAIKVENNEVAPLGGKQTATVTSHEEQDSSVFYAGDGVDADDDTEEAKIKDEFENETPDTTVAGGGDVKVKDEFEERKKQRKALYKRYQDKLLLHRHDPMSIPRLGGGVQDTFVRPRKKHPNVFDARGSLKSTYPVPKFVDVEEFDVTKKDSMLPFTYTCYSSLWQPNGPKYAGQPRAALDAIPKYFEESGEPFPVFMKRSLTEGDADNEGPLIGWEYVGNYKVTNILDEDDKFWESARNFSNASKKEIAKKHCESTRYGRERLAHWRARLMDELEKDPSPAAPQHLVERRCPTEMERNEKRPPMAARARALGFQPNMDNEELSKLLVELDEFHVQVPVAFDEYDERIYEYCNGFSESKFSRKNGNGGQLRPGEEPAKAVDWYNFAETKGLITY